MTTDKPISVRHAGTLSIVSSGYADRYVQSHVWIEILVDGITYRIHHSPDAAMAYVRLAHLEATEENLREAIKCIVAAPYVLTTTARTMTGTMTFQTCSDRLRVGIATCMGRPLTAGDKDLAGQLTPNEWTAIYAGLDAINRAHARDGKPVVNHDGPRQPERRASAQEDHA